MGRVHVYIMTMIKYEAYIYAVVSVLSFLLHIHDIETLSEALMDRKLYKLLVMFERLFGLVSSFRFQ